MKKNPTKLTRLKAAFQVGKSVYSCGHYDYYCAISVFIQCLDLLAQRMESEDALHENALHYASRIRTAINLLEIAYGDSIYESIDAGIYDPQEAIDKQQKASEIVWDFISHNIEYWWE